MQPRRWIAAVLTAALTLGTAAPALAADAADERLAQVTRAVKTTLDIGDEYEKFYGEPSETPLGRRWELIWSADGRDLNVTATEEGKVLNYSRREEGATEEKSGFGPSFPATTRAQGKASAQAFLDKVLTAGEKAVFQESDGPEPLNSTYYWYSGSIELNGIPSPLGFSARVRVSDGVVTSFWRDDVSQYVGALPAAASSTTAAKAAELLKGTLKMRLEYVQDETGEKAVLRYLPESVHEFYVDGQSGALVDLTELQEALRGADRGESGGSYNGLMTESAAEVPMADKQLSQAELEGVAKLEGTLSKEALDAAAKAWEELGLKGFELSSVSYRVERETAEPVAAYPAASYPAAVAEQAEAATAKVTATLVYARRTEEKISRRTVTLDARTGELLGVSGYNGYVDAPARVDQKAAQDKAESFLRKLWGDQFAQCALYDSGEAETVSGAWAFTYAQKVNGYFFPANALTVRVSADDGSVMGLSRRFDDTVEFDGAEGLISMDEAIDAWAATYPVELAYIEVPVALDLLGSEAEPLRQAGYSYYNALKPGYAYGAREARYSGVDAKTGKPVAGARYEEPRMTYDDLSGHWAEGAMTELAAYHVGWFGGRAQPDKALTQLDYIALLSSADGYAVDLSDEGAADELYGYACRRGLLTKEERADERVLARGEMVKLLLDSVGYKAVAGLPGIFRCDFADADAIPQEQLGYAALAQGLGLVSGGEDGSYAAGRAATRAEAAGMLWKYMKR